MAVLVADPCRLLVQGLGRDGSFQAQRIVEYGTNMVAAVHPNRAGMKFMDEVPYFETAREAVAATGANTGLVFVPAPFAMDAILEQARCRNLAYRLDNRRCAGSGHDEGEGVSGSH